MIVSYDSYDVEHGSTREPPGLGGDPMRHLLGTTVEHFRKLFLQFGQAPSVEKKSKLNQIETAS